MIQDKVYIIAETGVNHNGSLKMAKQLVDVAAEAGANAIKFQTFITEEVMIPQALKAEYQTKTTNQIETQYEMVKKLELNQDQFIILKEYCINKKIQFIATPFDLESLDFLIRVLDVPIIKIASGEITNAPLLLKTARSGKKIILSTGMCTLGDIEQALGVLAFDYLEGKNIRKVPSFNVFKEAYYSENGQQTLQDNVTLLHCTTEYPASFEDINLRSMDTLRVCFCLNVG